MEGQVRVLGPGDTRMLPSCVGYAPSGELLVGEPARNQHVLYPERTVRSIKRKMDSGNGSRATLSIRFSGLLGPLFARLTRKLNERYLALEASGLKERSVP